MKIKLNIIDSRVTMNRHLTLANKFYLLSKKYVNCLHFTWQTELASVRLTFCTISNNYHSWLIYLAETFYLLYSFKLLDKFYIKKFLIFSCVILNLEVSWLGLSQETKISLWYLIKIGLNAFWESCIRNMYIIFSTWGKIVNSLV